MALMDIGYEQPDNSPGAEHVRVLQRMQEFVDLREEQCKNESIKSVVRRLVTFYWGKVEGDLDAYYQKVNDILLDFLAMDYNSPEYYWRFLPDQVSCTVIEIFAGEPNAFTRPVAEITIPHASYKGDGLVRHLYAKMTIACTESFSDHVARVHAATSRRHNGGR